MFHVFFYLVVYVYIFKHANQQWSGRQLGVLRARSCLCEGSYAAMLVVHRVKHSRFLDQRVSRVGP